MAQQARRTDPKTSHAAARAFIDSGQHDTHTEVAMALVKKYPGYTFRHLYQRHEVDSARRGNNTTFEDAPALMRRLSECAHRYGHKQCRVSGRKCSRWWPKEYVPKPHTRTGIDL